jgi:P27 family predicted phage terminase small subunit
LHHYKLLSDLDTTALRAYCVCYGRWLEAEKLLTEKGSMVFRTQTGYETQSAYLNIINQCLKQINGYMAEFGMTPANREKLRALAGMGKQLSLFDDWGKTIEDERKKKEAEREKKQVQG